jgi:ASC-1-like (ASCH) protein
MARAYHELKIHPKYYQEVKSGNKRFEIRKNDRNFKEGDEVMLKEFADGHYTHAEPLWAYIGYVTDYEQKEGYVVFSLIRNEY